MRRLVWGLILAVLMLAWLPAAGPAASRLAPPAQAQAPLDDEIVVLQSDGRIVVNDPTVPAGIQRVTWQSDSTGWQYVATGDFNGDGDDEIIALRGGEARVFDPIQQPGRQPVQFNQTVAGQQWRVAVTGDVDGDGQDEIVLARTTSEGGTVERVQAFDPNAAATSWSLVFNEGFGTAWRHFAMGDVDGDGKAELAAIRNVVAPTYADKRITIWDPSNNWQTIYNVGDWNFEWLSIEIGNVDADSSGKSELVLTRSEVLGERPSYLVFRWVNSTTLTEVANGKYYPYFTEIALGDVNASGDDEVFLLRNAANTNSVGLLMINHGSDPTVPFETLRGQGQWRKIHTGDTDGDGRAELVVMSSSEYRLFTQPASNQNFEVTTGSFIGSGVFAIGNIDGPGRATGPALSLSKTTIDLTLVAGQGATDTVSVTNTGTSAPINWTATVIQGSEWLSVSPTNGVTPGTLTVIMNASNLLADQYVGKIKVDGGSSVTNGPQEITVNLTVTAPQFSVSPFALSWFHQQGRPTSAQTILVRGPGLPWAAGVVPITAAQSIEKALEAGATLKLADGQLIIEGETPQTVPVVDWVDITPQQGSATTDGSPVLVNLVPNRVPWGYSEVAVVFVALRTASPPAVVTRVRVQSFSDRNELYFVPMIN